MPRAKIKVNGMWYDLNQGMTLEEKTEIDGKLHDLTTSITVVQGQISTKISQTELDQGVLGANNYAKNYADSINNTLSQNISDVRGALDNLDTYMNTTFEDGIVYDSEKRRIEGYLNTLADSKAILDGRYNQIYNDPLLVDNLGATPPVTHKADLLTSKSNYDDKYSQLLSTINAVIADTKVDATEKSQVDVVYSAYSASIVSLSSELEKSVNFIAQKKADLAESHASDYTDGLIGPLAARVSTNESSIIQTAKDIELKVSSEQWNNKQMQDNWYNFVKSNSFNMFGDIEKEIPPEGYEWVLSALPDGTQGTVLSKKHISNSLRNLDPWLMPQVNVDPSKPYLMEFWVQAMDINSEVYFGREEYSVLPDGSLSDNDQGIGPYMVSANKADSTTAGVWVKHYAVIPPHNAGLANDHFTPQSAYTPDQEYKFWNASSTAIKPKVYLTYNVVDATQNSEMHAWGFGLYEIGSRINMYKEVEKLNIDMTSAKSSISQNSSQIALRVTTQTYTSTVSDINTRIDGVEASVTLSIEIISTNGLIFKNGQVDTALQAYVYKGGVDITNTIDSSRFIWKRTSGNTPEDDTWNLAHVGFKAVLVNSTDVKGRCTFECDILK